MKKSLALSKLDDAFAAELTTLFTNCVFQTITNDPDSFIRFTNGFNVVIKVYDNATKIITNQLKEN